MDALYYSKRKNNLIVCDLCPQNCNIEKGHTGECGVRINTGDRLETRVYGKISAMGIDPIEKKPLYHFQPGGKILSIGSYGCNLSCNFCQNHSISQVSDLSLISGRKSMTPEQIIDEALAIRNNVGVAFTYNEPTVYYEYMYDTAVLAKRNSMATVMVSNGYINPEPLDRLIDLIDAFNIDLKAFNNNFYRQQSGATLNPVLKSIKSIYNKGKHIELTFLIIPALNDNPEEFIECMKWISDNTGTDTAIHLSRYFPRYRSSAIMTPVSKLIEFHDIAREYINYVYLGNIDIDTGRNTNCPQCGQLIASRTGYSTIIKGSDESGNCTGCNRKVFNYSIP